MPIIKRPARPISAAIGVIPNKRLRQAGDAGFTMTHYMVTAAQLQTIESSVSGGAPND
ncbi:MAG TPA: hypothetical protein VFH68_24390 [Polyangia bacterium]|jgi:hypothetical protein|nr:hypothetical protein [Polyangia bacterium]